MESLSKNELVELDKKIDNRILSFDLLTKPRNQALFHILLIFDFRLDEMGKNPEILHKRYRNRRLYNSLNHVVEWIFDFCPNNKSVDYSNIFDSKVFFEAWDIFDEAMVYADLFSQMSLIFRGRSKCRKLKHNTFEISSSNFKDDNTEQARLILAQASDPRTFEETKEIFK